MHARFLASVALCAVLGCDGAKQDDKQGTDSSTGGSESAGESAGESGATDTGVMYGMPGEGCPPDVYECLPKAVVCEFSVPEAIDCGNLEKSSPTADWVAAHQCIIDAAAAGLPAFVLSVIEGTDGDYLYGHAISPDLVDGGIVVEYHPYTGHASRRICGSIGPEANCLPGQERLCLRCIDAGGYQQVCEATLPP